MIPKIFSSLYLIYIFWNLQFWKKNTWSFLFQYIFETNPSRASIKLMLIWNNIVSSKITLSENDILSYNSNEAFIASFKNCLFSIVHRYQMNPWNRFWLTPIISDSIENCNFTGSTQMKILVSPIKLLTIGTNISTNSMHIFICEPYIQFYTKIGIPCLNIACFVLLD